MDLIIYLIVHTFDFVEKVLFSPLVLIGLLITALSLILNLKDTNIYIKKFKKNKKILDFIDKIYYSIVLLIFMFIIGVLVHYIDLPKDFTIYEICICGILSFFYILLNIFLVINLFSIAFIIKEIVKTSLK